MMSNDHNFLKGVLEIYSPSGQEHVVSQYLVDKMNALNFDKAYVDDAGNAIGIRGNGSKTIMFMGHIDTVPGVIPVHLHEDAIWGRGACDAKGGIVSAIIALSQMSEEDLDGRTVIIAGCVEEEIHTSKGARHLLETFDAPQYLINGEPSGWDAITIGYKGCLRFEYYINQTVSHHASSEPAANEHAFSAIRSIHDYLDAQNYKKDSAFYKPYVELRSWKHKRTGLEEGIAIKGNVRIPPQFDDQSFLAHVSSIEKPGRFVFTESIAGVELSRSSHLARVFRSVLRKHSGVPREKLKTGSSDMNVVIEKWKDTQMLAYSPGDSSLDHTPNEHIKLKDFDASIKILKDAFRFI